ncbi:MAG TPA: nitrate- and nitrite sensing domain-containing protein, partial [Actinoplanes sp.]
MPENGSPSAAAPRRRLPRLRDAQIRSKLALILVVPLAAVLALAAVRLIDVGNRAYDTKQVEDLTRLATDVSELTHHMQLERMGGARYLAQAPNSPAARAASTAFDQQVVQTDNRIDRYTVRLRQLPQPPSAVQDRLSRIDEQLNALDGIRKQVRDRNQFPVSVEVLRYGTVITELVGYVEALAQIAGDGPVAKGLRAISAFARAKASAGDQQAIAFATRTSGNDLNTEQFSAFLSTIAGQQAAMQAFALSATQAQRSVIDETVTGPKIALAEQVNTDISRSLGGFARVTAEQAAEAYGAVVDLMRQAEQQLEADLVVRASDAATTVTRQASIEGILILITLLVALAIAFMLARSLNQSLRKLREGALSVANRDLPDAVARLRDVRNLGDGGADDILREVRDPIRVSNRDEIGQVAQAFNVVHTEAVRIAVEQAALRTSVSAMFLNLARRSQSLVDRMIGELDQIERGEEDPKRLAQLFQLDHLATRMRRNDENLLVLAGADSSAPRREDALLVDALRAAQSEIELYNRVEFGTVDTDISIAALAVNDVVRLIAELLDNATRFSPPTTVVVADGRRIRDYVIIQVEDRGLGMADEQMNNLNRRLAQPPGVDVAAFRLMGLAVVGRLASRYGIRVELRANIEGGTVAQVMLPSSIVVLPNKPTDQPVRGGRAPQQIDSGLSSTPVTGWANGRTATATLPAIAPGPWTPQRAEPTEDERLINATTTTLPAVPDQPRPPAEAPSGGTPGRSGLPVGPTMWNGSPASGGPSSGGPSSGGP